MKVAYVDTSYLLAIAFEELKSAAYKKRLESFDMLISSSLLESEVLAAFRREKIPLDAAENLLSGMQWLSVPERLRIYLKQVLDTGYLRGADAHHLASALWYAQKNIDQCVFLTLDTNQAQTARRLGFAK